jgi:surface antigen
MNPLVIITGASVSMKKEAMIVLGVIALLFALPIIALTSITNFGALADSGTQLYTDTAPVNDTYDYGYCTYWAALRRIQVGEPIPNTWGNANTWDDYARLAHYTIDHTPTQNAIMQTDAGLLGHVAFVESVQPDGSLTISEMNYKGWDEIDTRTLSAADAQNYSFIH